MEIGEQRVVDAHLIRVGFVGPYAVDADAEDLRVQILELFFVVDHAGVLFGAGRTPIERVED